MRCDGCLRSPAGHNKPAPSFLLMRNLSWVDPCHAHAALLNEFDLQEDDDRAKLAIDERVKREIWAGVFERIVPIGLQNAQYMADCAMDAYEAKFQPEVHAARVAERVEAKRIELEAERVAKMAIEAERAGMRAKVEA